MRYRDSDNIYEALFCITRCLSLMIIFCIVLSGCFRASSDSPPSSPSAGELHEPTETSVSPITGMPSKGEGSPVAICIGNNQSARMQSGLSQADIIYEVLTEGGITRYFAIFHDQAPEVVGPVRSARPYFVLLAKEWGAIFGHCGGDPKDIKPIKEWDVADADEFAFGNLYWRDNSRIPPDNLYTSVENLRKTVSTPLPSPSQRYQFQAWEDKPKPTLKIEYGWNYVVEYRYFSENDNEQGYERFVIDRGSERQQKDRDSEQPVVVSNVIIQFARSEVAYADGGLKIDLIGEGKAMYLLGGRWEKGTWVKTSVEEATLFLDENEEPVTLTPGQTWVQIVPMNAKVNVMER